MGMFSSINIASTGLTAQRTRLDVISNNIANANTTRTPDGGPYRRSRVVFKPQTEKTYWRGPFVPEEMHGDGGKGVKIAEIEKDMDSKTRLKYDPTHPDAIKSGPRKGYVEYPNVNIVNEMVDMISASRSYEANVQVVNGSKSMFGNALQIAR